MEGVKSGPASSFGLRLHAPSLHTYYNISLVTTIHGYYSASDFVCRPVRACNSLRTDEHGSVFWLCETMVETGKVLGMVVKPWRQGVDYSFIKEILAEGKPGLVQTFAISSNAHGPIQSGLCMRFYLMNLWEYCGQRSKAPFLSSLLRAGSDLLRGVKSFHELRDSYGRGLIHCAIRPQHFLCDPAGRFFLTGFDEVRGLYENQTELVEHAMHSSATAYPASCPPEILARLVDERMGSGFYDTSNAGTQAFRDHKDMIELASQPLTQAHDLFGLGFCILYLVRTPSGQHNQVFFDSYQNLLDLFPSPWNPNRKYTPQELGTITDAISSRSSFFLDDPESILPQSIKEALHTLMALNVQKRLPAAIVLDVFARAVEQINAEKLPYRLDELQALQNMQHVVKSKAQLRTSEPVAATLPTTEPAPSVSPEDVLPSTSRRVPLPNPLLPPVRTPRVKQEGQGKAKVPLKAKRKLATPGSTPRKTPSKSSAKGTSESTGRASFRPGGNTSSAQETTPRITRSRGTPAARSDQTMAEPVL